MYVSDIFNTRTRHYGLAVASASQWLFNFVLSKVTPTLVDDLGYKLFLMFGAINIAGMGTFSLLIPETKGRSLEEMDIIFGSVQADQRQADIAKQERGENPFILLMRLNHAHVTAAFIAFDHDASSSRSDNKEQEQKV